MHLYCIGIDYQSAPLEVREAALRKRRQIVEFWRRYPLQRASVLVTCNRIEVYAVGNDQSDSFLYRDLFLCSFTEFAQGYYVFGNSDVFSHALRLACGLESQLKGELQIVDQLTQWRLQADMSAELARFWTRVLAAALRIRQQSGLLKQEHTVASLVLNDIQEHIALSSDASIVIAGTGKIAELFASHIAPFMRLSFAAHKNFAKAQALAAQAQGEALLFSQLPLALAKVDVLVSATTSPHFVVSKETVASVCLKRSKPLYLYDLAVPRDIDPRVADLPNVVLRNLNDVFGQFDSYSNRLKSTIEYAQHLVQQEVCAYAGEHNEEYSENWHQAGCACA
ncbi:MAG: hypothetical protein KBA46_05160 [Candidatus Omnitrophica bacterium]|nr:hypothetical protein [Candidatus Omnitrophota bacterium]